jgi:serine/threonine protein kinase
MLFKRKCKKSHDIWSVGCTLYYMLTHERPFCRQILTHEAKENIKTGTYKEIRQVSNACRDLVRQMIEVDPEKRISAEKALKHEWFKLDVSELCGPNKDLFGRKVLFGKIEPEVPTNITLAVSSEVKKNHDNLTENDSSDDCFLLSDSINQSSVKQSQPNRLSSSVLQDSSPELASEEIEPLKNINEINTNDYGTSVKQTEPNRISSSVLQDLSPELASEEIEPSNIINEINSNDNVTSLEDQNVSCDNSKYSNEGKRAKKRGIHDSNLELQIRLKLKQFNKRI